MKCFLIRDLLPFYAEGQVSKETKTVIEQHFKECNHCRELYESITDYSSELKESAELIEAWEPKSDDREFWRKYYSSLYMKNIGLFFAVLFFIIEMVRFVKSFK
ncbi:zf-HC2 domain-containing protein [Clostridium swellfunianum]|uniref:anti-sigma factor family protein n=1 Tax=Clostridium swellfunianum TaxID=1367462 RepID=UPI00202E54ED|nr:zf-HC2 domain-containing protein [Clostridium swellfunianum]MCM0649158.1 zf-HC2 domain-containing protein [Clostridium swellfunianum]